MRIRTSLLLSLSYACFAQVPAEDSRNVNVITLDTHFAPPAFHSRAEWEARAAHLRKQIQFAAGLLPMPEKHPLGIQIFGRIERKGYTVEKVLLETMPGFYLGGNLYRPQGRSGPFPAIVSPHGHWAYGRLENSAVGSIPGRCINLARQGFVVFSYDMIGYDDTIQMPHVATAKREQLWGFGLLGMQLWDSIRTVDFLETISDVDRERIGATGASGGATQILMLQAIDPRIKFSSPVNMISSIYQGGSPCENAPLLRVGTNNMEIGALMAPRPMLMVSTTQDWTKNTPRIEYPAMQSIYRLYDREVNVQTREVDAPHNYNKDSREAVYRFFAKTVLGADPNAPDYAEKNFTPEKPNDLLALFNRTLPKNALTYAQLVEQWITFAERQNAATAPDRERLMLALAADWPEKVLSETAGERVVLSRAGVGDRVAGVWHNGSKPAALLVDADNADATQSTLKITVFQTGASVAPRDRGNSMFLTFNKTDDAERVQDILTALKWLNQDSTKLVCRGKAAVWCTLAASVSPKKVQLDAPVASFHGADQEWIDYMFIPSIQRAGGWPAVLKLVSAETHR